MNVSALVIVVGVMLTTTACGGATRGSSADPEAPANLSPELRAFDETLRPVWSTKAGEERVTAACNAAEQLVERARATKDSTLSSYTFTMQKECEDPLKDEVEGWLTKVNQRFRELSSK